MKRSDVGLLRGGLVFILLLSGLGSAISGFVRLLRPEISPTFPSEGIAARNHNGQFQIASDGTTRVRLELGKLTAIEDHWVVTDGKVEQNKRIIYRFPQNTPDWGLIKNDALTLANPIAVCEFPTHDLLKLQDSRGKAIPVSINVEVAYAKPIGGNNFEIAHTNFTRTVELLVRNEEELGRTREAQLESERSHSLQRLIISAVCFGFIALIAKVWK